MHWGRLEWVLASLLAATALFALPFWLTLAHYLHVDQGSYTAGQTLSTQYGNLIQGQPLRALQIAGIWPYSDFRDWPGAPPFDSTHALIWLTFASGALALAWTAWRRRGGLALFVGVALVGALALYWGGSTPWLIGKALAIGSPAILLAGLVGGALLFGSERIVALIAGVLVLGAIAAGVLWSNWLQYRNVTLAPRDQLSELQTLGAMVAHKGPTFINEYEIYADRHFLRAGAPVEPAEYRTPLLPTVTGAVLTDGAFADIDSFPLSTLLPYRSLVIRRSPVESQPPSVYHLVWQGRFYQLWQQPAQPTERIVTHVPLGDTALDYCGPAEYGRPEEPLCSIQPAAIPSCPQVLALARQADGVGGYLLAHEMTNPIVLRGTQTVWPAAWTDDVAQQALTPTTPGTAVAHVEIPTGPHRYQLWLGGSFARGFNVSVNGRRVGSISNEINNNGDYNMVGSPIELGAGVATIDITYPQPTLAPGGDEDEADYTALSEIALQQLGTPSALLRVKPSQAATLCGRSLDWIEVVVPLMPQ
jgi:hypothetical protein